MSAGTTFIESLDDARIAAYRDLKDRELAQHDGRFIAEGEHVVQRLLESDFQVESVLLAQRRVRKFSPLVPDHVPVYVVSDGLIHEVVGFKFHSGVIACGKRKPPKTFEQAMASVPRRATLMILPEIANTENLGGLMRIAAGFGVDAMILGQWCCDPFYRQSIRVSMGAVFRLNLVQSQDLLADLDRLKRQWNVQLVAAVVDNDAEPLHLAQRSERIGLVFGNEAQGLSPQIMAACDRRVTIPMKLGTDSLNVAIAAAVFLFHFCSAESDR